MRKPSIERGVAARARPHPGEVALAHHPPAPRRQAPVLARPPQTHPAARRWSRRIGTRGCRGHTSGLSAVIMKGRSPNTRTGAA